MPVQIPVLAQQLAPIITPYLPYLLKGAKTLGTAAVKGLTEAGLKFAEKVWEKLDPAVKSDPNVAGRLEEAAARPEDPRTETLVSWELEKILAALPPSEVNEIHKVVTQEKTEMRTVTASGNRAVAIGGDASGSTITTGDQK